MQSALKETRKLLDSRIGRKNGKNFSNVAKLLGINFFGKEGQEAEAFPSPL